MMTAKKIEAIVQTGAAHVLYREDGGWYHHLKHFPGVLFDINGMLLFETEEDYIKSNYLTHRKDLNVNGGISNIPGYIRFQDDIVSKIKILGKKEEFINEPEAWLLFFKNAQKYETANEIFLSPKEGSRYKIISTVKQTVKIKRMEVKNSFETVGKEKFKTCIERINKKNFPINKSSIYEHVVEETTIVELLPMLDWSEDGSKIVFNDYAKEELISEVPEAPNDNINKTILTFLKVRRGQKKLREKLFSLYSVKCAITGCDVKDVLHACHMIPFAVSGNNISTNALLLRSDIHDIFDANLLGIEPFSKKISVHNSLRNSSYFDLDGLVLRERTDGIQPDLESLTYRWKLFKGI